MCDFNNIDEYKEKQMNDASQSHKYWPPPCPNYYHPPCPWCGFYHPPLQYGPSSGSAPATTVYRTTITSGGTYGAIETRSSDAGSP